MIEGCAILAVIVDFRAQTASVLQNCKSVLKRRKKKKNRSACFRNMDESISNLNQYTLETYSDRNTRFLKRYFSKHSDTVYIYKGNKKDCNRLQRKAARRGYSTKLYKSIYGRSDNYRKIFFDQKGSQEAYRCVYCGRMVHKNHITIDHVIPVYDAKRYYSARIALKLMGCEGANDPKNLVPSCFRCNERKGTSWNLIYLIRAKYGDSQDYWKAVKIARITFAVTILALLVVCLTRKGAR